MTDISAWSTVDDNNLNPSPAGWPEGMMPSGVNNSARAMMGSLKRWRDQTQPTVSAGGTANALVLTYPVAPAALALGDLFSFFTNSTNTGAVTLQVNAQAARPLLRPDTIALVGGEITPGFLTVVFDGASFRIANGSAAAIGAVPVSGGTVTGNLTVNGTVTAGLDVTAGRNFSVVGTTYLNTTNTGPLTASSLTVTGALTTLEETVSDRITAGNITVTNALTVSHGIQYPGYGIPSPATNIGFGYSYANGFLYVIANDAFVGTLGPVLSDERLKRDIGPVTVDPLAALNRVQLKAFSQVSARNDPSDGMLRRDVGFIAQQVREAVPDAVVEPPLGSDYLGLDLMPLVAYCVGAIQQLAVRVEELETALIK